MGADNESIGLQTRSCYDMSGGMVTARNFSKVTNRQCLRLLNADSNQDGSRQTRRGRSKLNSTALAGNPTVNSLSALGQTSGGDKIFSGANGTLSEMSSGVDVTLKSGLDASAYLASTEMDDYKFFCNGINAPFMTKGLAANTYQVGITAPSNYAGFSAAATAGGNATVGTHLIAMRWRSTITGARSNPFISSGTIQTISVAPAAANLTYSITVSATQVSADTQVDTIDYFVTEAAGTASGPFYYLGSSANAAATYNFGTNVSDNELIVKERLDIDDNTAPTSLINWCEWRGFLIGPTGGNSIVWSKWRFDGNSVINIPTSWPSTNSAEIGGGDGDPVVRCINFNDYVFIFKRRSIYLLVGNIDSSEFYFQRLKTNFTNVGLLNMKAICQAGDKAYFVSDDLKFWSFGMTDFSTEELRLSKIPLSDAIKDLFMTFASAYRQNLNVGNYTFADYTQIWINFSDGVGGPSAAQNFNTFVYDWGLLDDDGVGSWHINTGNQIASMVVARGSDGSYFVFSGDYYGFIWKHDLTSLGDGAAINGTSSGGNTSTTFNDTTKTFTSALIGTFLTILSGTGQDQIRRITGVPSATQLTVDTWTVTPDNTSEYTIGGIDFEVWSRFDWMDDGSPVDFDKQGWFLDIDVETQGNYGFSVYLVKDRVGSVAAAVTRTFSFSGSFWGVSLWGVGTWSESQKNFAQVGFDLLFKQLSHRIINRKAGQPLKINGWTYSFQTLDKVRL